MSTITPSIVAGNGVRRRLAVFAILALTLVSAALDRRNTVYGRDTGETRQVEHRAAPPSAEEMVRDMLNHD